MFWIVLGIFSVFEIISYFFLRGFDYGVLNFLIYHSGDFNNAAILAWLINKVVCNIKLACMISLIVFIVIEWNDWADLVAVVVGILFTFLFMETRK